MPFTVGFLQAHARALGVHMGEHRAAAAINRLRQRGTLIKVGDYRARRHGFRVALYDVAPRHKASVRRRRLVKWWEHPLFGNPDGEKPRDEPQGRLRRWGSPLFLSDERRRNEDHMLRVQEDIQS
jgi:hypothetical protein